MHVDPLEWAGPAPWP